MSWPVHILQDFQAWLSWPINTLQDIRHNALFQANLQAKNITLQGVIILTIILKPDLAGKPIPYRRGKSEWRHNIYVISS